LGWPPENKLLVCWDETVAAQSGQFTNRRPKLTEGHGLFAGFKDSCDKPGLPPENADGVGEFEPSGWSVATTLATSYKQTTLKALGLSGINPFRVAAEPLFASQGCRCAPTTGLEFANAFGVLSKAKVWRIEQGESSPAIRRV
jgi:hypothetical protein